MGTSNGGHTHPVLALHSEVDMMVVQRLCHGRNQTRHKPQLKRPCTECGMEVWEPEQDVGIASEPWTVTTHVSTVSGSISGNSTLYPTYPCF